MSKLFEYPKQIVPTTLLAIFTGPIRYESPDLPDHYIEGKNPNILIYEKPSIGNFYATHQQKKSRIGFMVQWPFCCHAWFWLKMQKQNEFGQWIPGSEFGKYFRFGLWRFDKSGTIVDGDLRHWMGPWSIYINLSKNWD